MGSRENPPFLSQRKLPPNILGGARWEECTVDPPIHKKKEGERAIGQEGRSCQLLRAATCILNIFVCWRGRGRG